MNRPTKQTFSLFITCLSLWFSANTLAEDQDAVVVLYSHGSTWTSEVPGTKHGIFFGIIYDGSERLATLREGIVAKNNRFVVFKLAPGMHTFSASYVSHPVKNSQLTIFLAPQKHYFLRAQSESRGVPVVWSSEKGRLDQVTCDIAHRETETAKPLASKSIPTAVVGRLLPVQAVPLCQ